jgi:Ser/Thr protein kinase RdoA (MazF antagonist)
MLIRARIARFRSASVVAYRSVRDLTEREKKHLLNEILQVRGLMPLLMKPRNKQRWTPEDRAELQLHLRRLSSISPYLVVIALPGSFLMLPALAWWLDRRRNRQQPGPATPT